MTDGAGGGLRRPLASLGTIAREWTRIGLTGFGGPPAHVALLRDLVVDRRGWMDARAFEDANAACGLLPGPASTQLMIFCAYRVGGARGAIVGGLGFVVPAVVLVLALSVVFLAQAPPTWVSGAGAGAGVAVAAVAVHAGRRLIGPSFEQVREDGRREAGWLAYLLLGAAGAALIGPYLVLVLVGCGLLELVLRRRASGTLGVHWPPLAALAPAAVASGGIGALAWTAFKVGALSFGGGFVIIPPDAGGRRRHQSLDDQCRVPERGRPGADHPRTGDRHDRRGRLRGPRDRGRAVRGSGRLCAVVLLHPARWRAVRAAAGQRGRPCLPQRSRPGGDRRDPRCRDHPWRPR